MEKIQAGYVAFNGHVITDTQADIYNRACEHAARYPNNDFLKDCQHRTFAAIIALSSDPEYKPTKMQVKP
jgi:hypothetical protein